MLQLLNSAPNEPTVTITNAVKERAERDCVHVTFGPQRSLHERAVKKSCGRGAQFDLPSEQASMIQEAQGRRGLLLLSLTTCRPHGFWQSGAI